MNQANFPIRKARIEDAQQLAELHFLSHTESFQEFADPAWIDSRDFQSYLGFWSSCLEDQGQDEITLTAWADQQLIGTVTIMKLSSCSSLFRPMVEHGLREDQLCCLRLMYVHPGWVRQGLGTGLMDAGVSFMSSAGYRLSTLITHAANSRARSFYEARGWVLEEVFTAQVADFFAEPEQMRKRARYRLDRIS